MNLHTAYNILELNQNSNENDIKKAYHKLSKQWHPDKNNTEEATRKFQEINEAKDKILDNLKNNSNNNNNFNFIFNFNNSVNISKVKKENNIIDNINVSLEQIYNEENIIYNYKHKIICNNCNGNEIECDECSGSGKKTQVHQFGFMIQQFICTCNKCNGSGIIIINNNCSVCNGTGTLLNSSTIDIKLNSDMKNGFNIVFNDKGHIMKTYNTDLIIIVNEIKHNYFIRIDNDLYINIMLNIFEALFGFDKIITYFNEKKIYIKCREKTEMNIIRKIENYGMKNGNLYIKFTYNLDLPEEILQILNKLYKPIENEDELNNFDNIIKPDMIDISSINFPN